MLLKMPAVSLLAGVASLTLPKVAATTSTATPDILNEIYHSTLCAQMSQLWSIPTDCPQVSQSFETCFGGVNRSLVCLWLGYVASTQP